MCLLEQVHDLLVMNREGLMGDMEVRSCLGQSHHEMSEFSILGEVGGWGGEGAEKLLPWTSGGWTLNSGRENPLEVHTEG